MGSYLACAQCGKLDKPGLNPATPRERHLASHLIYWCLSFLTRRVGLSAG